jgi:hypothetical protein
MELLLFPELARFADKHGLKMVLVQQQNFYPDISFVDDDGHRFALDLKSTYRTGAEHVNGMTLGAFTGYFLFSLLVLLAQNQQNLVFDAHRGGNITWLAYQNNHKLLYNLSQMKPFRY